MNLQSKLNFCARGSPGTSRARLRPAAERPLEPVDPVFRPSRGGSPYLRGGRSPLCARSGRPGQLDRL